MNVNLNSPISITIDSAKLVVEDDNRGTIEFTLFDQPVHLNIDSSLYTYDTNISIGDRIKLIENFGAFNIDSEGIVQEIIPDYTEDRVVVLFDTIIPDQVINPVEAHVVSTMAKLLVTLPLKSVEKI